MRLRCAVVLLLLFTTTPVYQGCTAQQRQRIQQLDQTQLLRTSIGTARIGIGVTSRVLAELVRPVQNGGLGKISYAEGKKWRDKLHTAAGYLDKSEVMLLGGQLQAAEGELNEAQKLVIEVQSFTEKENLKP